MDIDWAAIEKFVGFGPADAPFVFVGMEEGLDKDADLKADLLARAQYQPNMDLLNAQSRLCSGSDYVGESAKCQRTWRPMCDLMLRFEMTVPTRLLRNRYQGTRLGRIPGQTLITELLPYPRNSTGNWPYAHLGRFESFEDYRAELLGPRIEMLRYEVGKYPRRLIVCYGSQYWKHYEKLVSVKRWRGDKLFRSGRDENTGAGVLLTWHFRLQPFNTDEQLASFYALATAVAK